MKVMVLVKANKDSEAGHMPSQELLTEMGNFNEVLNEAGVLLSMEGLHPTVQAKRVACTGKQRTVMDGPFSETKELLAGYWIWQVASMDEAVEWVRKSPFQQGELELRPVFEMDDFGDEFAPELREQELKVLTDAAMRKTTVQPYLFFSGRCDEALEFYKTAISATIGWVALGLRDPRVFTMAFKSNSQLPSSLESNI